MKDTDKKVDLLIVNGRIVCDDHVIIGNILIEKGKVYSITSNAVNENNASKIINAAGKYVLPGIVDTHVHFRTPGLTYKEDWKHGTKAAAAGGVTTVIDMPNTYPYLSSIKLLDEKFTMVSGKSLVDYGFHFGATSYNIQFIRNFDLKRTASIKVFLTGHNTAKNIIKSDEELEKLFKIAHQQHLMLTFHAEDDDFFSRVRKFNKIPTNIYNYEKYLSRTGGIIAVNKLINFAKKYRTQVHILHVSSKEEVNLIELAKKDKIPITFETTPHHLFFNAEDSRYINRGTLLKLSPCIRRKEDQDKLWEAILKKTITCIGSDHAPHTLNEKNVSFNDAPPGLPGIQEMLSIFLTISQKKLPNLSNDQKAILISQLFSKNPSELFKIRNKGMISSGYDADIILVDLNKKWSLSKKEIYSKCGWSPYNLESLIGKVILTIRRGEVIYNNGKFGHFTGKPIIYCNR